LIAYVLIGGKEWSAAISEEMEHTLASTKPVKGYEGLYLVADNGEVFACEKVVYNGRGFGKKKAKKLKPGKRAGGYKFVYLTKDGIGKCVAVHRIVAEAFLDNPDNLPEVNHKDENPANNNVSNLEWCTRQYNIEYSKAKRVQQIDSYGNTIAVYKSIKYASIVTGIGRTNINNALRGWSETAGGYFWQYVED
jgi:hypothetical protein